MATLTLDGVSKRYGSVTVVHDLGIVIEDGEFVVLVGPSGCGKSTTLRMIAGLDDISAGTIFIGDRVVNNLPPRARNISMVFQNYALYPHMTVAENLGFGLKIAKVERSEIETRVAEAADILGLTPLMGRLPGQLSGGQRQRVAMGRAIVRKPDVFLFDEPLSNLDAQLRGQVRVEIKKLHQRLGATIVYVTHDQVEAMTLADRMVIMRDGQIEQVGTPLDVFERPANIFVARFIGSPPMNQLPATMPGQSAVLENGIELPLPPAIARNVRDGQTVTLGFRPDHFAPVGHHLPISGPTAKVNGRVSVTEALGSEAILRTSMGNLEVLGKMLNPRFVTIGEELEFVLELEKLHIFDAKTGQRCD